jgi:hypothetical protein
MNPVAILFFNLTFESVSLVAKLVISLNETALTFIFIGDDKFPYSPLAWGITALLKE